MKNFIVCNASAGSGKTFTLVKMYISLAFDVEGACCGDDVLTNKVKAQLRDRYKHILAITFTKKATNEMKERIMSKLASMAKDAAGCDIAQSMVDDAVKEGRLLDSNDARSKEFSRLQNYALAVHSAILHDYSDLSVFTIDSFMHRVVRTFAHDLHLPLNFDVTQRQEDVSLEVVDKIMRSIGADDEKELTEVLTHYMDSKMDDDKSYRVEGEISARCEELFKESASQYLEVLKDKSIDDFKKVIEKLTNDNKDFEDTIKKEALRIMVLIDSAGLDVSDFSNGERGSIYKLVKSMSEGSFPDKLNATQQKYYDDATKGASSKSTKKAEIIALHPPIKDLIDFWSNGLMLYNTRAALMNNIYTVALMNRLNMEAHQFYDENEVLHMSEFNKLIAKVVSDEPAPFIYERLGTWYRDFLLDEFQDTSHMQWHNLLPLLSNAIGDGGRVFIVGDGKQAIYRFRNGDATIFTNLPAVEQNDHGHGDNFRDAYEPLNLETNFRSMANVVNFNNNLFLWIAKDRIGVDGDQLPSLIPDVYLGKEGGKYLDGEESHLWQKNKKDGGYVEVALMKKGETESGDEYSRRIYEAMYNTIKRQLELGYDYRDIMILTRNNKELTSICAYLSDKEINGEKIKMASAESFLLSNSRVVMLIINTMRYVVDPTDRTASTTVVLLLKQLGVLVGDYDTDIVKKEYEGLEKILEKEGIILNVSTLRSLSIYECCEEILRVYGVSAHDKEANNEVDYIAAFLSVVAAYGNTNRQDLANFLAWYEEQVDFSAKTSEDMDAIRMMTIHKAKGLEAKVVLYPMLEREHGVDSSQWVAVGEDIRKKLGINLPAAYVRTKKGERTLFPDLYGREERDAEMDALNVLYVALTRPKHKLFVFCEKDGKKATSGQKNINKFCSSEVWSAMRKKENEESSVEHYVVGEDFAKPKENVSEEEINSKPATLPLNVLTFGDWKEKILIAAKAEPMQSGVNEAVEYGIMLHDVMSKIYHRSDIESAVAEYADGHGLSDDKAQFLLGDVRRIVDHPDCAPFFADNVDVRNECEMVCEGEMTGNDSNDKIMTFRADRIVIDKAENKVYVVDYKTGKDDDNKRERHKRQVDRYCNILRQMGYYNVEGYLIYTHNGVSVMKTSD